MKISTELPLLLKGDRVIEKQPGRDQNGRRLRRRTGTVEKVDLFSTAFHYMTRYDDGGVKWSSGADIELAATSGM